MININKEMLQILAGILVWYFLCFIVPYVGYWLDEKSNV